MLPNPIARLCGAMLGLFLLAAASAQALAADQAPFTVFHPPTTTTLTTAGSDGHQPGDLRVISLPVSDADGKPTGRLDALLTTTAIDTPAEGDEIRVTELVFSFDSGDVIIIGGSGIYPKQGPTLKPGTSLVRPIKGAAGRFAGQTGWCESVHKEDGSWSHSFHFATP
ncbi:MAG: hypothetical protein AB7G46_06625 [Alphaproteobacteria bacterium]